MNSIRFDLVNDPDRPEHKRIRVYVDSRALEELARDVEAPFAEREGNPTIAGRYVGISPHEYEISPVELFMGRAQKRVFKIGDRTMVLGCECGEPQCWPLVCRIQVFGDRVIWSDFHQPHRERPPGWRHDGLGPFVFDRDAYEKALQAVVMTDSG